VDALSLRVIPLNARAYRDRLYSVLFIYIYAHVVHVMITLAMPHTRRGYFRIHHTRVYAGLLRIRGIGCYLDRDEGTKRE